MVFDPAVVVPADHDLFGVRAEFEPVGEILDLLASAPVGDVAGVDQEITGVGDVDVVVTAVRVAENYDSGHRAKVGASITRRARRSLGNGGAT